jgi:putative Mg2+ transporter-C (MgtC) family protein
MLSFEQMMIRFFVALALGALIGLERELVGKEAGIRTTMLVSGGAAIFSLIAITLPYVVALSPENLPDVIARNSGFLAVIANIVVGIGFLGAGIILKSEGHVHGLTTAAVVWVAAAIGTLAGLGLTKFALVSSIIITGLLYFLRKIGLYEHVRPAESSHNPE